MEGAPSTLKEGRGAVVAQPFREENGARPRLVREGDALSGFGLGGGERRPPFRHGNGDLARLLQEGGGFFSRGIS